MTEVINVEPRLPFADPTILAMTANTTVSTSARYLLSVSANDPSWILTVPAGRTHRIVNTGANQFRVAYTTGTIAVPAGASADVSWSTTNNAHVVQLTASQSYDDTITSGSANAPKTSAVKTYVDSEVANASGAVIVDNLAAIRSYVTNPERIIARGHTTVGDGGGGVFRRVTSSGAVVGDDDNGWHVRHTASSSLYSREGSYATPEMFGAVGAETHLLAIAAGDQYTALQQFFNFVIRRTDFNGWTFHPDDERPNGRVQRYYRSDSPIELKIDFDADWTDGNYPGAIDMTGAIVTPNTVDTEAFIIDFNRNAGKSPIQLKAVKARGLDGKVTWNSDPWPELWRDPDAYDAWSGSHTVFAGEELKHTLASGATMLYEVTVSGVTGASGPTHTTGTATNGTATLQALGTIRNTSGLSCQQMLTRCRDIAFHVVRCWECDNLDFESVGYTIGQASVPRVSVGAAVGFNEFRSMQHVGCKVGIVHANYLFDEEVADQTARLALTGLPIGFLVRQTNDATNDWRFNGPLGAESTAGNWSSVARDTTHNWANENVYHSGLIYGRGDGTMINNDRSLYGAVVTEINTGIQQPSHNHFYNLNAESAEPTGNAEVVQILYYSGIESTATGRNDAPDKNRAAVFCKRGVDGTEPYQNAVTVARAGKYGVDATRRKDRNNGRHNLVTQVPSDHKITKRLEIPSLLKDAVFSGNGVTGSIFFRETAIWDPRQAAPFQSATTGFTSRWLFDPVTKSFSNSIFFPITALVELPDNITEDAEIEVEAYLADSTGFFRVMAVLFDPITGAYGTPEYTRARSPVQFHPLGEDGPIISSVSSGRYHYRTPNDSRQTVYASVERWVKKMCLGIYGQKITGYRFELKNARNGRIYAPGRDATKYPGPVGAAVPEWGVYQAPSNIYNSNRTSGTKYWYLDKTTENVDYWATSGLSSAISSPAQYQMAHNGAGTLQQWDGSTWQTVLTGVNCVGPSDWKGVSATSQTRIVDSVQAMRSLTGVTHGDICETRGHTTIGIGANRYRYDAASSATDDNGFFIAASGMGVGRWVAVDQTVADVTKFGAIGNGVADDTAALLAAFASGNPVFLPEGNFRYSGNAEIQANIRGTGNGSVLSLISGTAQLLLDIDRLELSDFRIVPEATMTVPCIEIGTGTDISGYRAFWKIENVFINKGVSGTIQDGIKVTNGLSGIIRNCRVDGGNDASNPLGTGIGIHVTNANAGWANAIELSANKVRGFQTANIRYENGYNGYVTNNVVEAFCPLNLHIKDCVQMTLVGNYHEARTAATADDRLLVLENVGLSSVFGGVFAAAEKSIELIGNSYDNFLFGTTAFETNGSCLELGASTARNTVFMGYVPQAKITNDGTNNTIYFDGGFDAGTEALPGIRIANQDGANTGIHATGSLLNLVVGGVTYAQANVNGLFVLRNGAARVALQDTNSTTRDARLLQTTVNGTWKAGPVLASGSNYRITSPADSHVLELAPPATAIIGGTARIIGGTGSPEGAATAPVGSLFLRTDGGTGSTLYVKESGTGNTGWVAK